MAANIAPVAAARMEGLYSIPVEHGVEAASQVYKKGSFLIYSSGKVAIAGANPASILGIAANAATGVTSTDAPYIPVLLQILFELCVDGALVATNAPGTGKPSDLTIGATYGISLDAASGNWYLDSSKSAANQVARLIEYDSDQSAVINGRVRVRILIANTYF